MKQSRAGDARPRESCFAPLAMAVKATAPVNTLSAPGAERELG